MSLKMVFLDVGNADSIVLTTPEGNVIIVDAPRPRKVLVYLDKNNASEVNSIYYTHDHQDHLPSLSGIVTLVENLRRQRKKINFLFLPTLVLRKFFAKQYEGDSQRSDALLRHALDKLELWHQEQAPKVVRSEAGAEARTLDGVTIDVLHPDMLFYESIGAESPNKINETSLVLRVEYGDFSALLLGDIEGEGLRHLLDNIAPSCLRCQILKIPHHGAWPKDNQSIQDLFATADPEIAILSVGSRNPHGHVAPSLFTKLWLMKMDVSSRLQEFVCTEVTRTCIFSSSERGLMARKGLNEIRPCAGDIEIICDISGSWQRKNAAAHIQIIEGVPRAACAGNADIEQ